MNLADSIRTIRFRLRLNQAALAARVGLTHHSNISKYERGALEPSPAVLMNLLRLAEGEERAPILEALGSSAGDRGGVQPESATRAPIFDAMARSLSEAVDNVLALIEQPVEDISEDPLAAATIAEIMKLWQLGRGDPAFREKLESARRLLDEDRLDSSDSEFIALMRRFECTAEPDQVAFLKRHAEAIVAIEEKRAKKQPKERAG